MKSPNSMTSHVNVRILEIALVLKFLGERTYHSENEHIYHPNFVWFVERSSSAGINPKSYHLAASELMNRLLYINFPSL